MSLRSVTTFVLTGGAVTVIHVAVGLIAHHFGGLEPFNANLVAFAVAFLFSYFGHRNLSFRSPGRIRRSMPRFFALSLTNLVLNQVIVYVVSGIMGYAYWIALGVMVVVVPTFTYMVSALWIFDDGDF